jgi:hypothetical protein
MSVDLKFLHETSRRDKGNVSSHETYRRKRRKLDETRTESRSSFHPCDFFFVPSADEAAAAGGDGVAGGEGGVGRRYRRRWLHGRGRELRRVRGGRRRQPGAWGREHAGSTGRRVHGRELRREQLCW